MMTRVPISSKSLRVLVNLKHLGNLHNELSHGNWSQGSRGKLVGAVRRRLGDDVDDAAVQGGGGKLSTGSQSKQPWEMTESEWEQHVKSRAGIQGLPKDAVAEYLQSQLMSGRHIAKVVATEDSSRGNRYTVDISSPRTSTVRETTTYDESDEKKRRPHKTLYDSAVIDKDGKIIDKRYQSQREAIPAVRDENQTSLFRGMQGSEFISAIKSGKFRSTGEMLMGSQSGTYFATNAHQASSYAGFFAPWQYGPTFEQPSYVVEIRRPKRARNTEQGGEVEVLGSISTARIIRVFELRVATERAGEQDLIPHETKYREGKELLQSGGSNGLSQTLVVREVPKGEWGNTFHKQQVQQAISEGKPVPPSVLADYPELAATSSKSLRVNLKHLGNLHNQRSHGNWSTGPRGEGISMAVDLRKMAGLPKPIPDDLKRLLDEISQDKREVTPNGFLSILHSSEMTLQQRHRAQAILLEAIQQWENNPRRAHSDLEISRDIAEMAIEGLGESNPYSTLSTRQSRLVYPDSAGMNLMVLRDRAGRLSGVAQYYRTPDGNIKVVAFGTNPSSGNRAGETIMWQMGGRLSGNQIMYLHPLDEAYPFYRNIGMVEVGGSNTDTNNAYVGSGNLFWPKPNRQEFIDRIDGIVEAQYDQLAGESTKEVKRFQMTPEIKKWYAQLTKSEETGGCLISDDSKKGGKSLSSRKLKSLRVNLKHLGNLHNELSHGTWSKGPRKTLVGAVRRRLGDDIDDATVQGGGGVRGKPKISKTLSSIQDIKLSRNAVVQEIDSRNFTGRQLQQITEKLLTEIRKWKDNPNRPEVDANMAIEMVPAARDIRSWRRSQRGMRSP